jgi:hypothetical protein
MCCYSPDVAVQINVLRAKPRSTRSGSKCSQYAESFSGYIGKPNVDHEFWDTYNFFLIRRK